MDSDAEDLDGLLDGASQASSTGTASRDGGASKRAISVVEVGPRMALQLIKVQDGMCDGAVLFNRHGKITSEEKKARLVQKQRATDAKRAARAQQRQENMAESELHVPAKRTSAAPRDRAGRPAKRPRGAPRADPDDGPE